MDPSGKVQARAALGLQREPTMRNAQHHIGSGVAGRDEVAPVAIATIRHDNIPGFERIVIQMFATVAIPKHHLAEPPCTEIVGGM